ncbi:MAG: PTS system mannose/fructose/sorbose family transporter subunit IID [bacterium]|nr:MAG: PTS system mannose/fructose/sorbose family transporter subunit IID [bacterium]
MSRYERVRFFLRTLAIQGSWNFPQMQGLGFFFAIVPWLRKVSGEGFQSACRRHLAYFNTHPFFAPYILGAVAKLEEEGKGQEAAAVRRSLMGPLGAVGDGLYWGKVRPASILLAMAVSLIWPWAAAPVFLLVFNLIQIPARWRYLAEGYRSAADPHGGVARVNSRTISRLSEKLIPAGCGFIAGAVAFGTDKPGISLGLFFIAFLLFRRRARTLSVLVCLLAVALCLGWLGVRVRLPWSW